ncbi:MAG: chorismate synthase [Proteobacteria bacterium]|nr:chorismate synthase [Pseudomonadota bacterium]
MKALRFLTAGESHGRGLAAILDGMPAGLTLEAGYLNAQLKRRQQGYGRGGRMKIESDEAEILSGVRHGKTLGSPIALLIWNRDWKNWTEAMKVEPGGDESLKSVSVPRPGHADYQGIVKYGHSDVRNVLERASARETAARVAVGTVARRFLEEFGIEIGSRVVSIGDVVDEEAGEDLSGAELNRRCDASEVRVLGKSAEKKMIAAIDAAKKAGDTLGGVVEVRVTGLPLGLGSYVQWDRRLEGDLGKAFLSMNAIKGVEIGMGFETARAPGSKAHDELFWDKTKTHAVRKTNRSGGIDGGMTTGMPLVIRAAMKPLATLMEPLRSIDLKSKQEVTAHIERSDVCAVPAAGVICETLAALELADAFLVKVGGDSIQEIRAHYDATRKV